MKQGKYCKLIMVTAENNNKFYEMKEVNGSIVVTYGRVESTSTTMTYPLGKWDSLYNSKTKKGYKDVTHLVAVEPEKPAKETKKADDGLSGISDALVRDFIGRMKAYTDNLVKKTYSVKADKVSQAQVDEAQALINGLLKLDPKKDEKKINDELLKLYMVIPRFMSNTRLHLLPQLNFDRAMVQEQDNLDAMAAQVHLIAKEKKKKTKTATKKEEAVAKSILDTLGVKMKPGSTNIPELKYLLHQVSQARRKVVGILTVEKEAEDKIFEGWMKTQKNKETRILIHGTRCTSVIPIIEQGLKIRPAGNFQFSGKVYGDGNYFSEVVNKSLNYTGYDNDKILLVYEVHTGKPFVYDGWYRGNSFSLNYTELQKRGFDSTHVNAGNGLLNSEIIAYKEEQCRLKHIIWLN